MTNRTWFRNLFVIVLLGNVVVGATTFYFYKSFNLTFLWTITKLFIIAFLLCVVGLLFYIFVIKKGLHDFWIDFKIRNNIEQNLISIGAYYNKTDKNIYFLPPVKIDVAKSVITIVLDDVKIRKAVETYIDYFSSALPDNFVIKDYYISNSGNEFYIYYRDETKDNQIQYNSINEYLTHIDTYKPFEIEVDNEHIINLIDNSHWLLSGSSGSGKSFLSQLLTIQFIRKGFEVSIYDVKQSYSAFADYIEDYETSPDTILEKLCAVADEMKQRQSTIKDLLKTNPRALAVDYGYKQKIIIIEEYIGLKTMLAKDKDKIKLLENIIKEISVLARSVNISLFIVAQSSSVDLIDASIKNNLNKIFLGYLASNIQVSTFGTGVEVPTFNKIKKGYGYIQLDKVEQIKVPNVVYSVEELKILKNNLCEEKAESLFSQIS